MILSQVFFVPKKKQMLTSPEIRRAGVELFTCIYFKLLQQISQAQPVTPFLCLASEGFPEGKQHSEPNPSTDPFHLSLCGKLNSEYLLS